MRRKTHFLQSQYEIDFVFVGKIIKFILKNARLCAKIQNQGRKNESYKRVIFGANLVITPVLECELKSFGNFECKKHHGQNMAHKLVKFCP